MALDFTHPLVIAAVLALFGGVMYEHATIARSHYLATDAIRRISILEEKTSNIESIVHSLKNDFEKEKRNGADQLKDGLKPVYDVLRGIEKDVEGELRRTKETTQDLTRRVENLSKRSEDEISGSRSRTSLVEQRLLRLQDQVETLNRNSGGGNSSPKSASNTGPSSNQAGGGKRDVVELVPAGFQAALKDGVDFVLMFYAPWCGHCKSMMPTYEQAAKASRIVFARIDGSAYQQFATQSEIQGFPTLRRYTGGQLAATYNGDRSLQSLLDFASS